MEQLLILIASLIVIGSFVYRVISVTYSWVKSEIRRRLAARNARKVLMAKLEKLVEANDNEIPLDELEQQGYSHVMATVDNRGNVDDVEIIKDTNAVTDEEVEELINRTDSGMVTVTK